MASFRNTLLLGATCASVAFASAAFAADAPATTSDEVAISGDASATTDAAAKPAKKSAHKGKHKAKHKGKKAKADKKEAAPVAAK